MNNQKPLIDPVYFFYGLFIFGLLMLAFATGVIK